MLSHFFSIHCNYKDENTPGKQSQSQNLYQEESINPTSGEPGHIEVQHILIAFDGSLPGRDVERTEAEAEKLAQDILSLAQNGESFDELVRSHTNDSFPGRYKMANNGIQPVPGEYRREQMVPAFGNVGFKLNVGEAEIANYAPGTSPFGWHIIKRIQ